MPVDDRSLPGVDARGVHADRGLPASASGDTLEYKAEAHARERAERGT